MAIYVIGENYSIFVSNSIGLEEATRHAFKDRVSCIRKRTSPQLSSPTPPAMAPPAPAA
ncbi:hypothetical protein [Desulfoscipio geothermicus]|uniref:hypothetical protein n=1 Tax=Desulfoscipio geothermicus TaxID=39060 RepID=UPI001A962798|nr:hypothetical protein [Desulfoscipio geothermicus]